MTEINFYVSKEQGLEHRLNIAYRLVNLALQRKMQIYIHTDSEATSAKLDEFLWNKEASSFIPHAVISNDKNATIEERTLQQQINISHDFEPLSGCDYLINLSNQLPEFFSRFLKVAEIVDNNEDILTAGRKRYSFYRDRGYTLGYHQL